jgi:hypothetical protein
MPLRVSVSVMSPTDTWRTDVQPKQGTVVEALALAAQQAHWPFSYTSRGSSIYLDKFGPDPVMRWTVRLNGVAITDLTQATLRQGDSLTLE